LKELGTAGDILVESMVSLLLKLYFDFGLLSIASWQSEFFSFWKTWLSLAL
jgi:hypothetical protein